MTTTTDTKVFVGILRKSFLEPNKSGEGAHWHIDLGDLQKPWGFNMFDEEEGERLALGKTYEITYVLKKNEKKPQFPPFKNFVSIREVEPAPAKPAGSPGEGVGEPEPPDPHRRSIERQTALKAAVEFASMWTHPGEMKPPAFVLEYADAFYKWLANGKLSQPKPVEQVSAPAAAPDAGPKASPLEVSKPVQLDIREQMLAIRHNNLGSFFTNAVDKLWYHNRTEVLVALGIKRPEEIVDITEAWIKLVDKKYPEAKEA